MAYSGAQILAWLATISTLINALFTIPDPTVSLLAKYLAVIIAALSAAVTAAVQFGLIPELMRLKRRK